MKTVRKTLDTLLVALLLLALYLTVHRAFAIEPGLYGAGNDQGNGFSIHCNDSGACQAIWFNHIDETVAPPIMGGVTTVVNTSTETGGIWLWADPLCDRGLGECPVDLRLASGSWNANLGPFEFTEPVGSAVLNQIDRETILVDYEVLQLRPGQCNTGAGGLLLRKCVANRVPYRLIAGEQ